MRATHICYKHPRHLRVETGQRYPAWYVGVGDYHEDALCVAPSASIYAKLNRSGLPCCIREAGGDCHIHGRKD